MTVKKGFRDELIGRQVLAEYARTTFRGKVIDETKSTITLEGGKMLLKTGLTIKEIDGKTVNIRGKNIHARPHERIK